MACTLSFILGLPSLGSSVAFSAATSIATIGLYISYGEASHHLPLFLQALILEGTWCLGIPIALRVIYRRDFKKGPFHLGAFSLPVSTAAVLWIVFISIAFILPQVNVCFAYYAITHIPIYIPTSEILPLARQLTNPQLRNCRCWDCHCVLHGLLAPEWPQVGYRPCEADCW